MQNTERLVWLGKIVLTILTLGAVIGIVGAVIGIVSSALFPGATDSTLFYIIVGGFSGMALVLVLRALSHRGFL